MEPFTILILAFQASPPRHIGVGNCASIAPIIIASGGRVPDFAAAAAKRAK
jgi:hypothetical protein